MNQKDFQDTTRDVPYSIYFLNEGLTESGLSIQKRNSRILKTFQIQNQSSNIKRSHLFNGRYENIYIDKQHIPELNDILEQAIKQVEKMTGAKKIKAGFWFNYMPPESKTLAHRHDDDDEIMSAVYYIDVPENSGNLIIHSEPENIEIKPKEGMFVFFKPDIVHEVSCNNSQENRLSIGMNFGLQANNQ